MSFDSKIRGTIETEFSIGIGGPQIKNNAGVIEARNPSDASYVNVRGGDPVLANDLVTKEYSDRVVTTPQTHQFLTHSWGVYYWPDSFRTEFDHRIKQHNRLLRQIGTQFNQRINVLAPSTSDQSLFMSYGWHEAHPGATFATTAAALPGYLASTGAPDLSTVLLGTNDCLLYAPDVLAGTKTPADVVAIMQAGATTIFNTLAAAGTTHVFFCDVASMYAPAVDPTQANLIAVAWNAALPAFVAALSLTSTTCQAHAIIGLQYLTIADTDKNSGDHPNRRGSTTIGRLLADNIAPYVRPTTLTTATQFGKCASIAASETGATPNQGTRMVDTGSGLTCGTNIANMKPTGSWMMVQDFLPTALPAGTYNIWRYADLAANGVALELNGSAIQVNVQGSRTNTNINLAVGNWYRIGLWYDATSQWMMVFVNGIAVDAFQVISTVTVNQTTYWGTVAGDGTSAAVGLYGRWSMNNGSSLPTFAPNAVNDIVQCIAGDFQYDTRVPGCTSEFLMVESTNPLDSFTSAAALFVGNVLQYTNTLFPRWCDEVVSSPLPTSNVVNSVVSGFSGSNYYEGPVGTGIGWTGAAGSLTVVFARGEAVLGSSEYLVGEADFPLTQWVVADLVNSGGSDLVSIDATFGGGSGYPARLLTAAQSQGNIHVETVRLGAGAGACTVVVDGVTGGTTSDSATYAETGGTTFAIGAFPRSHNLPATTTGILAVLTSTSTLSVAQAIAFEQDVFMFGVEQAYKVAQGTNLSVYLAVDAKKTTWAPRVGSGPTLTRTGTPTVSPIIAVL